MMIIERNKIFALIDVLVTSLPAKLKTSFCLSIAGR
jgi:hypothetical protein